jgi:hypothetical protein
MTRPWDTASALSALLDALEVDLIDAPKQEVQAALHETGRVQESAIYELRSMLRDVQAEGHNRHPLAKLPDEHDGMSAQQH